MLNAVFRLAHGRGESITERVPSAEADSLASFASPGTHVPGYSYAAAARLKHGLSRGSVYHGVSLEPLLP